MAELSVRELIDSGIHFGHRASRWNPKMQPYIFGKRNLIHIIDLKETVKGILRAKKFLAQVVAEGKDVLFVATKRQAKAIVDREAKRCNMPFVNERWLGGMLTNFRTIRERLKYLEQLEALEKSGEIATYSKKMIAKINREMEKIRRNLDGVRAMNRLPGVVFVVDPRREDIAVREARRLGIPTVALMDTDSDPDEVSLVIPGNDDAMRAIEIVVSQMADAVQEGLANRATRPMTQEKMREVVPETVPSRRPRGRRAGGAGRGGPGRGAPAGGGRGEGGRGGRGGGRGRRGAEKRGPDPSQIAERGAPRPAAPKPEAAPAEAAAEEKPAAPAAAPAETAYAAAEAKPAPASAESAEAKPAAAPAEATPAAAEAKPADEKPKAAADKPEEPNAAPAETAGEATEEKSE